MAYSRKLNEVVQEGGIEKRTFDKVKIKKRTFQKLAFASSTRSFQGVKSKWPPSMCRRSHESAVFSFFFFKQMAAVNIHKVTISSERMCTKHKPTSAVLSFAYSKKCVP